MKQKPALVGPVFVFSGSDLKVGSKAHLFT